MERVVFKKTGRDLLVLCLATLIITFLVWLPHLLRISNFYSLNFSGGFNNVYRNFDGMEYIIIAKTFYSPSLMAGLPQSQPAIYFASHFPLYSFLILLVAPILGFLKSMLFISLLSTIGATLAFYFLVKDFKLTDHPLLLSIIFLILPARWLIVHSIGSSEPTFILFLLLSFYAFLKFEQTQKYSFIILTSAFGLLAQLTRPPGILIFLSLAIFIHWKYFLHLKRLSFKTRFLQHLRYFPIILIPLGLLGVFYLYSQSLHDFWAYFHSGDNIHLTFPLFQVFNKNQPWVGEIWLEDIIYVFMLGLLGGLMLIKQKLYPLAFFVLTYLSATFLVAHRDISRYALPIFPFVLIAFEKILTSKEFRIVLIILSLAIYLYAQNFILNNTAPYPNLSLFN